MSHYSRPPSSSASSSSSLANNEKQDHAERLARVHANIVSLPEELCAASTLSTPLSEARMQRLHRKVVKAVMTARNDLSNPKWTHVSRMLKLQCTGRGYVGVAEGVRMGDTHSVEAGDYRWVLPDTEEEWAGCEERWADRFKTRPSEKAKASKYWQRSSQNVVAETQQEHTQGTIKAYTVREKVTNWRADVVRETAPTPPSPVSIADKKNSKEMCAPKEKSAPSTKAQTQLGFAAMKRTNVMHRKPHLAQPPSILFHIASADNAPAAPINVQIPIDVQAATSVQTPIEFTPVEAQLPPSPSTQVEHEETDAVSTASSFPQAQVAELSEMSFLPPSFPYGIQTSTPRASEKAKPLRIRQKPAPIPHHPHYSSLSPQSQPAAMAMGEPPLNLDASSSQPVFSPTKPAAKRPRQNTPTPQGGPLDGVSDVTPPPKRAREAVPSSGIFPPPSTPPTRTSEVDAPITPPPPVPSSKGLGNAKGLPVPTTPHRQALPTLNELLASSRRSKPRPRPPSRKVRPAIKPQQHIDMQPVAPVAQDVIMPIYPAEQADEVQEPEPVTPRTTFSSPASGSSDSPGSTRDRPRSPISPLFTQQPDVFAPVLASTQRLDVRAGLLPSAGGSTARGLGSGFFGMYNSQFDVEGQVGRVSELLEHDVDFNGWLRDIPDEEEEEEEAAALAQGLNQSQGMSQSQGLSQSQSQSQLAA